MDEYRYPKNGYARVAVALIYGERSKHLEQFSVFGLPPHSPSRMRYLEQEDARDPSLGPGINMCTRVVSFGNGFGLYTTFTQGTGVNTVIALQYTENESQKDSAPNVVIGDLSDILFNGSEYEYFERNWDNQVQYKVDVLAKLVRAVDTGEVSLYPLFVADFPCISEYLLSRPYSIPKRTPLWK
jgi:hypothetical protein